LEVRTYVRWGIKMTPVFWRGKNRGKKGGLLLRIRGRKERPEKGEGKKKVLPYSEGN